jgi:conjugative transfer signal peptidase TraF
MPDARVFPAPRPIRWFPTRRHLLERARQRTAFLAVIAVSTATLAATLLWQPSPLLLWNASASSPIGLYRIGSAAGVRAGDMVVAWPPDQARALGAERHYLPRNVPLVKRVAAIDGDRVCAAGSTILVNGRIVARRRAADPSGRPMPGWIGCERLAAGELFLLTPGVPEAFDGRYFGVTRGALVVGRARLVWPR